LFERAGWLRGSAIADRCRFLFVFESVVAAKRAALYFGEAEHPATSAPSFQIVIPAFAGMTVGEGATIR
jgi:hypothetical protein